MNSRVMSGGLLLLAVMTVAGCGSKPDGGAVGDPPNNGAAAKADSPKTTQTTNGGKDAKSKKPAPVTDAKDGPQVQPATELTRLDHDGIVIFYKGFTEGQMKAYLNYVRQYWPRILDYQLVVAKQNKGMRIVRENDFTKIMVPAGAKGDRHDLNGMALPLGSLVKIDESAKGKWAFAICNDDLGIVFQASERFNSGAKLPPWSPEVEGAVQAIKKLGGTIVVEDKTVPGSPVIGVIFHNSGVTGDTLEPLTKIPSLRDVKLTTCYRLTDLTYVVRISGLQTLLLHKSNLLTDDALAPLVKLERLTTLSLPTATGDSGLEHVGKITSLTHLDLTENSKITDAGLDRIAGLKNLTHLKLAQKIGDAGLSRLPALTSLQSLDCSGCRGKITSDGMRHLAGVTGLRELDLRDVSVTDSGLDHLAALKDLRTLRLTKVGKVTDQGVIRLKQAIPGLDVQR